MKNLKLLSIALLLSLFALQLNAQSRPGAKKVDNTTSKEIKSDEVEEAKPAPIEVKDDAAVITNPEIQTGSKPDKQNPSIDAGTVKPAPRPKPQQETVAVPVSQESNNVKDKQAQRMHAEERSNGNAFSGKGKGGDKNLVDPVKKNKQKSKANKKIKSEEIKK